MRLLKSIAERHIGSNAGVVGGALESSPRNWHRMARSNHMAGEMRVVCDAAGTSSRMEPPTLFIGDRGTSGRGTDAPAPPDTYDQRFGGKEPPLIHVVVLDERTLLAELIANFLSTHRDLFARPAVSSQFRLPEVLSGLNPAPSEDVFFIPSGTLFPLATTARLVLHTFPHAKLLLLLPPTPLPRVPLNLMAEGVLGVLQHDSPVDEILFAIRRVHSRCLYISQGILSELGSDSSVRNTAGSASELAALSNLTPRESQVFFRLASAMDIKEIAYELSLDARTVAVFARSVRRKLCLRNSVEIARFAIRHGILPP